jgi:hypothetical protein
VDHIQQGLVPAQFIGGGFGDRKFDAGTAQCARQGFIPRRCALGGVGIERQGALVSRVMRISMGSLALDKSLSRGQYRQLNEEELAALLKSPASPEPETADP